MMAVRNRCQRGGSTRVIESIYDAAVDATLWPQALETVRAYIWADSALLRVYGGDFADVIQVTAVGFDSSYVRTYRDELVHEDPMVPLLETLPPGRMILLEDALAPENPREMRVGCEHAKPQHKRHVMGGSVLRRDGIEVMIGVQRGQDAPEFGGRELMRLKRIVPHIARALSLTDHLEQILLRARLADTMLGTPLTGVLLLDAFGRVTYLSPAAESVLTGQKVLSLHHGRLKTPYPKLQQWLDLVTVCERREAKGKCWKGSSARFTAFDGTGDLALMVLPWRDAERMPAWPATGVVTIGLLTPLDCRETFSVEGIQTLFGLTRGEAALTAALVTSGNLIAAAQCLGIRPSTARDRLKSVYRKTGFKTQMALACAIVRSATRQVTPVEADRSVNTETT